mgnify:CR=1 FL=1
MQLPNNLASLTDVIAKLPQQQIAKALSAMLLIYIASLAAQATWMFVPSEQVSSQEMETSQNRPTKKPTAISISALEKLHLFGVYNALPSEKLIEIEDAPETRLKLTLSAVVASNDLSVSAAIIENDGQQNTYGIDDMIAGTKATLEQVFIDRVFIKQSGRMETLMIEGSNYEKRSVNLPKKKVSPANNQRATTAKATPSIVDMRSNRELSQQASTLKMDISLDPGKITDYLKIMPKRDDGNIVGYRLMPGKNPAFFHRAGLKSGDVAVQMNGYDLTAPSEAAQAMMALSQENEVSLLVEREDGMTQILFSIDN